MAEGKIKSRTFRRVKKNTPGNRVVTHYVKKNPQKAHCAKCGTLLQAVRHGTPNTINKLSKTQRRPERPFGGVLCSKCSREKIKSTARS